MINREMRPVQIISFQTGINEYGQKRSVESGRRTTDMVCKIYVQTETQSPLFNDVELIGLTKDFTITDANQVQVDNKKYNIKYTIPSGKYLQILMSGV